MIDNTHDAEAISWVESANGHADFPIQNLPLGVFSHPMFGPRPGVAIGDCVLDLRALADSGRLPPLVANALVHVDLRWLLGLGAEVRRDLRHRLFSMLEVGSALRAVLQPMLHEPPIRMLLPARPGGYTDFYAGIVHATNVGGLLRPENPLMPNYKYIPIGYHGRTSSIRQSGTPVRRPSGQVKLAAGDDPEYIPTRRLDYEVELGLWIGQGNRLGEPVPIARAADEIAGVTLLNDWSARDVQAWEYQPLGPFLGKNFATTVSPWIVTMEALAPFRTAQPARGSGDPRPLAYLSDVQDQAAGAIDIEINVGMTTSSMRAAGAPVQTLGRTSSANLYWTPAQLVAHHCSNGCSLEPGDLLGTGTISSPGVDGLGSLMEKTRGGSETFIVGTEERRTFLEDGDEVVMTGRCQRTGFASIGLGECRATILPALRPGESR